MKVFFLCLFLTSCASYMQPYLQDSPELAYRKSTNNYNVECEKQTNCDIANKEDVNSFFTDSYTIHYQKLETK